MDTMIMLFKWSLGLGLTLAIGCSAAQNSGRQLQDTPFLHFQKTPCLGTCPSYEATILENGRIRYTGYKHVPLQDTASFELPPQVLEELRQDVAALNYTALNATYLTNWSDMPSTITTFYEQGKEAKRVIEEEGGPEPLLDFQKKVHTLLMELAEQEARNRLPLK
ncbi:DUF6438 domain-containing protein [uncultured Pontibacter sp.]|uniref:DUF6438 domain-containing protein n=1 Tax=uncultured Pontibacter sp. TaxID=453356 RepID=UPI00262FD765|nr:DUF6438 domain-containing protein [uncultured Pontibacter sp.]